MYIAKCNYDPSRYFDGLQKIDLYECRNTGMRFWRPSSIAGDEDFYASLSRLWPNYYKTDRWEYEGARKAIGKNPSMVLEVGCGRGYFLKSLETTVQEAAGLELNRKAIHEKVTTFPVYPVTIHEYAKTRTVKCNCVFSFQVLEHVADPMTFLTELAHLVCSKGKLIISAPNYEFPLHASLGDAFDLPPHHLNHFTPSVFKRIADVMGFKLISIATQKTVEPRFKFRVSSDHTKAQQFLRVFINKLANRVSSQVHAGHTILVVFEVP
jgi:SAM-dependent methyltransferase